ncbi:AraC family transcriptional regulator [Anaerocolumna xylanovorans]|uniref:AraC-type DNA-binding protein n=1 Tax=Anaerocolumna xylanovorans DSM 12503 TaxID=1121345 RepID=A0A1M7YFV6_9FIRM|nr:AraC family transcriptional regulator [Anaerocolumna xylanovorans]SHO51524.1 AraC-type DNA-binding protein [Anaerocolumna xylanovorans DSM 12503]
MAALAEITTEHIMFGYSYSNETSKDYQLHCHNFFEVYYFLEGDVDYLVEGKHYKPVPHSMLLLAPNVFHGVRINSDTTYRRIALHFFPELLSMERRTMLLSVFPGVTREDKKEIYYEGTAKEKFYPFLEALIECAKLPADLRDTFVPVYLEALLSRIKACQSKTGIPDKTEGNSETINQVINYLNEHFTSQITLDFIAERFCLSKHHLNKVFRRATGTTLWDYLTYKRVIYAKQLLMGGHSAEEASRLCGFSDYSAFYRAYRKITGNSPVKDRGSLPSLIQ